MVTITDGLTFFFFLTIACVLGPFANQFLQSPDTYRRLITKDVTLTVKHDVCSNGCYLFPTIQPEVNKCINQECQQQRYKNSEQVEAERNNANRDSDMPLPVLVPHHQISYTSIKQALTELYANDDNLNMLQYGYDFMKED